MAAKIKNGVLRFITAGSVDDGKSTLIGRLLYDSKAIFADQLHAIETASERRGLSATDLSLLTDGLQAEREQGITIDVAYRYFATPTRKFIIADSPGHEQYTRNMVTAASTADLAVILIDARKGVVTQTRRHAYLAHLLGIQHFILAVNKMDLVNYSQTVFDDIQIEFNTYAAAIGIDDVQAIPMSALQGDMIVERGNNLDWYQEETLLDALEDIATTNALQEAPFRFPVQLVSRPLSLAGNELRGYMGRIESGAISVGDEVVVLPTGSKTRVTEIITLEGNAGRAFAGESVTLAINDDLDIARGDMFALTNNPPNVTKRFDAMLCWFGQESLSTVGRYLIKHTTRIVRARIPSVVFRVDPNTLEQHEKLTTLHMNDIAQVAVQTQQPLLFDPYITNRATGSFIVIDEATNNTVAAGMIL